MNFSEQEGTAQAYAESGDVDVQSIDDLTAGGDGIDAESNAVATADFDQSADQENDNELTASGSLVDQDQVVLQFNVSDQDGEADAYASSGDVSVSQTGKLSSGGTGIIASSNAAAIATLEQTADQDNSNTISATRCGSSRSSRLFCRRTSTSSRARLTPPPTLAT